MDGETRRDFVSRERYDLLLDEAQAVERERARLEAEVQRAEVHRAGLERDLGHAQEALARTEERHETDRGSLRALEGALSTARTEQAVDRVRLERLDDLLTRVSELEEANNKLAFALKDASQGYRQLLLEAGEGAGPGARTVARPRRLATLLAGAGVVLVALVVGGYQLGEMRSALAAERTTQQDREEARLERERSSRAEFERALADTARHLAELEDANALQARLAEEAAAARLEALEARLERDRAAWKSERGEILGALDQRTEVLGALEARTAELARLATLSLEARPAPAESLEVEAKAAEVTSPALELPAEPAKSAPDPEAQDAESPVHEIPILELAIPANQAPENQSPEGAGTPVDGPPAEQLPLVELPPEAPTEASETPAAGESE